MEKKNNFQWHFYKPLHCIQKIVVFMILCMIVIHKIISTILKKIFLHYTADNIIIVSTYKIASDAKKSKHKKKRVYCQRLKSLMVCWSETTKNSIRLLI